MHAQHNAVPGDLDEMSENQVLKDKIRELETQNRALKFQIQKLERDIVGLTEAGDGIEDIRKRLVRRQLICSLYTALGHQSNDPRGGTLNWLKGQGAEYLRSISGWDQDQTRDLLELMDPSPPTSIIHMGNDAAHGYSFDDAKRAVGEDEESLRLVIDLFTVQYGESGDMHGAAARLRDTWDPDKTKLGELASSIKGWKQNRDQGRPTQGQGVARACQSKEQDAKRQAMNADWRRGTEK